MSHALCAVGHRVFWVGFMHRAHCRPCEFHAHFTGWAALVYGGYVGRGWERNVASSYQQHPHLISAPNNGYWWLEDALELGRGIILLLDSSKKMCEIPFFWQPHEAL